MYDKVVQGTDESNAGRRVDTVKYGAGTLSGAYEAVGEFCRYEVALDVPENWSLHDKATSGSYFELKELTFI